ncbi:MAG: PucR family transcriptional regulator [Nitriliruptoraceae bacterium]
MGTLQGRNRDPLTDWSPRPRIGSPISSVSTPGAGIGAEERPSPALPRLREVLATPELERGGPRVLAGEQRLDEPVRWVHVSELPDIAHLLQGGELILTTGIGLPDEPRELQRYIEDLVRVQATGVVVELGRRFTELPRALVETARRRRFPLIVLDHEIRFVRVTEAVHVDIINRHVSVLEQVQRVHTVFTELAVEGASADDIVGEAASLSGLPAVLENLTHRVIAAHHPGGSLADFLDGWARRSRGLTVDDRIGIAQQGSEAWLVGDVGARGERWGRLLMRLDARAVEQPQFATSIVERAATALVLNRLGDQDRDSFESHAERTLIAQIRHGTTSLSSVAARAAALGTPLHDRLLAALVVRPRSTDPRLDGLERDLAQIGRVLTGAIRACGLQAIGGPLPSDDIGLVVAREGGGESLFDACQQLAARAHADLAAHGLPAVIIAASSVVHDLRDLRDAFVEAEQVATAAIPSADDQVLWTPEDIRLAGLVQLLRDDPRMQRFVERQLGPVLQEADVAEPTIMSALGAFLDHGGNKSAAADALGISRPTLYQRLQRVERVLGVDLDAIETRMSLYVAYLALRSTRGDAAGGRGSNVDDG